MNKQKINQETILDAIEKTAQIMVRKHELYENIKSINEELKTLYESAPPMVASFGFKVDGDAAKNITGFVEKPNISYINQLEKEMGEEGSETINEVEILKMENEKLRKELEELKVIKPQV